MYFKLALSHQYSSGAVAFASDFSAPTGGYHLLYAGDRGISLTRDHQLVPVSLVCSNGASALVGSYLVDMLHVATDFSVDENLVENGLQQIPLAGTAELEPGDLLGTSPCPLLRVPVESLLYDDHNASSSNPGAPDNSRTFVPGPVTPHTAGLSPTPACADPFVHHVEEQPFVGGPDAAQPTSADLEPLPSLFDCLNSDQRELPTSLAQAAEASPRNLTRFPRSGLGPRRHNPVGRHLDRVRRCLLHVTYRVWFVLPPAVPSFGPTRQPPGDLSPLSRESSRGQTDGHDSGRVSRGWPHTALHVAVREPCGHHTEEIRRDSAQYQLQKVGQHQDSRSTSHTPRRRNPRQAGHRTDIFPL